MIPQSDTDLWIKSPYANIYRYGSKGKYHIRAKVGGKLVRQSLQTKSLEIAKAKADEILKAERATLEKKDPAEITFKELAEEYEKRLHELKPRAKDYRMGTLKRIRATWPNVDSLRPKAFTDEAVLHWAVKLRVRPKTGATAYNGTVQTLRGILQVAVDWGLLQRNPARSRKRHSKDGVPAAAVPIVAPPVPQASEFKRLLEALDSMPSRHKAALFVRFLAFTGMRISAAQKIMPSHVLIPTNEILIPPLKKEDKPTRLPILPDLLPVVKQLLEDHPGEGPLLPIANPKKALAHACRDCGLPRLSPHKLRHLFATRAISSGVDVKTTAAWLGHRDGGALLLRRYAHLLNDHSQKMAKKVRF